MNTQPAAATSKAERVNLRVDSETKSILTRAAQMSDASLSEFLVKTALNKAYRLVSLPEQTRVSKDDFFRVLDLIDNTPEPTGYLVGAIRRFS